jgi:mannosyltransferase OCH1-like enzyme
MIPKNIFQTWYTKDLPHEIQNIINRMKQLNHNYNYYLYTDDEMDDFVREHYTGEIYESYSKLNLIVAKADFWRYLVLYKYGGVYLDMDSAIDFRLDDFIGREDAILSSESGRHSFTQWALFFNMNHPILKRTIEFIVYNIKHNRYPNDVLRMTGPVVFAEAIQSIHQEYFGRSLDIANISGNTDIILTWRSESYRIYGNDYRGKIQFKHRHAHLLYNDKKPHWKTLTGNGVLKK